MINDIVSARRVISFGVDVNARDQEGLTPLLRAVLVGSVEIVALLLEHGADPSIAGSDDYPGEKGILALHAAAATASDHTYQLLLGAGADLTVVGPDGHSVLHKVAGSGAGTANHTALWELIIAERHVALDEIGRKDGRTCLHVAAASGLGGFVDAVLAAVVDDAERKWLVEMRDGEGRTALHYAANRTVSYVSGAKHPPSCCEFSGGCLTVCLSALPIIPWPFVSWNVFY